MTDANQISGIEAIRQVIEEGETMDYIDVVNEVKKRFRIDVTSAQVEDLVHDLVTHKAKSRPAPRISVEMNSQLPSQTSQANHDQSGSTSPPSAIQPTDELALALHFVKSVHGLTNAKRALAELESMLRQ